MTLELGVYGAKVQSWRKVNPRDLLKGLIEKHPRLSQDRLLILLKEAATEDHVESMIEYWFANNYRSLISEITRPPPATREDLDAKQALEDSHISAAVTAMKDRIREEAQVMLLDMVLPNGKRLRECTFGYVAKLGGCLARIGAKGKTNQMVGKVLSEAQVAKLYAS